MTWLIAVSCSGKEECVKDDLENKSFVCYLPRFREKSKINNRVVWVARNLFGRYFFVMMNEEWRKIFSSPNLFGILMNEGKPSEVRESIVEEIKSREDSNGFVKVEETIPPRFHRGQMVRVTNGQLLGMIGMFNGDYDDYRDRARVLFDMMGRKTTVVMRQDELVLVENKKLKKRKRYIHRSLAIAS